MDEVRALLAEPTGGAREPTYSADPRAGYADWAASYDDPGNPIVALEEPEVRALVDSLSPGRALDAACGTGRHSRHLVDAGHQVTGLDLTPEMLERAAAAVPEASFVEADVRRIPAPDAAFDLVVCGLALAHLERLDRAVGEMGRVLRAGGRLVVSVLHPFLAHLGWQAPFQDADGRRGFVREYTHTHADYLDAFQSAGLRVTGCREPRLEDVHVQAKQRAFARLPEATTRAYAGLPAVLIWDLEKPDPQR